MATKTPTETPAETPAKRRISNLRDHVLNQNTVPEELVHVPEWDTDDAECWILVRSLNGKERAKFQSLSETRQGGTTVVNYDRVWADLVIMTARDPEDGSRLFESADRDMLLSKAAVPLERLSKVARLLSGLDNDALPKSDSASEGD